jgi:hypothetical protein
MRMGCPSPNPAQHRWRWLTEGKSPGKICRQASPLPTWRTAFPLREMKLIKPNQYLNFSNSVAWRSHSEWRIAVMGVMEVFKV